MDCVANKLSASGMPMRIVAITGNDAHARGRLESIRVKPPVSLHVIGWTEEVAALMQAASLLITKPGGLTTAEAAMSGLPMVVFDTIPGPEQHNAAHLTETGGAVIASNADQAADEALALLGDVDRRRMMSRRIHEMAEPDAAHRIASLTLNGEMQLLETPMGRAI
jgi:processive 1,2-diacylglycerol beta-glucosyltransferase